MKTKKLWSAILSLALVVSTVSGVTWSAQQANAKETEATGKKVLAYVAVENDAATGAAIRIDKTPVLLPEGATALDALQTVLDANGYQGKYKVTDSGYGKTIDVIDGLGSVALDAYTWLYWSFGVNGEAASVVAGNQILEDNDQISYVYTSEYTNVECDSYKDSDENDPTEEEAKALVEKATQKEQTLAAAIYKEQFENGKVVPGLDDVNGLYSVFSLARANYGVNDASVQAFYDAVYTKLVEQFADIKAGVPVYDTQGKEITFNSILTDGYAATFYAKVALCVEALGKSPKDVGGINIIEKLADKSVYDASNSYITTRASMVLFALDAIAAELPEGDGYLTREEIVQEILAEVDNQIATSITWNSLDSAAMVIQALAPYRSVGVGEVSGDDISATVNKVLRFLATMQESDGTYGKDTWNPNGNIWTLAQVMITMGCYDIAPITQEKGVEFDFIKNGKTVFDAVASYINEQDDIVDESLMRYQPEQLLRGLTACIRTEKRENGLFSLVENASYTAKESTKTKLTADMIGAIADQTFTGEECTPEVVVTANGKVLSKDIDYRVTYFDNTEEGDKTASIVIQGIGEYYMNQRVNFSIVKKQEVLQTNPPAASTSPTASPNTNPTSTKKPANNTTKKISLKKPVIKSIKAGKKSLTVRYAKVKNAKKYIVEISTSKKFKKSVKKKTVKGTKAVFKKLTSKKKYYIRVSAVNGKSKSAYSKVKSKKAK